MRATPGKRLTLKTRFGLAALAASLLALPSATAQAVVPPGNSAVNQYTETFPTVRGAQTTKRNPKQKDQARTPSEALGREGARKLAAEGAIGREVAEVVAATAPSGAAERTTVRDSAPAGKEPEGSSGLREVVGQATGTSDSGRMGLLLPLLILAAVAGSVFYFWRHRRQAA